MTIHVLASKVCKNLPGALGKYSVFITNILKINHCDELLSDPKPLVSNLHWLKLLSFNRILWMKMKWRHQATNGLLTDQSRSLLIYTKKYIMESTLSGLQFLFKMFFTLNPLW